MLGAPRPAISQLPWNRCIAVGCQWFPEWLLENINLACAPDGGLAAAAAHETKSPQYRQKVGCGLLVLAPTRDTETPLSCVSWRRA